MQIRPMTEDRGPGCQLTISSRLVARIREGLIKCISLQITLFVNPSLVNRKTSPVQVIMMLIIKQLQYWMFLVGYSIFKKSSFEGGPKTGHILSFIRCNFEPEFTGFAASYTKGRSLRGSLRSKSRGNLPELLGSSIQGDPGSATPLLFVLSGMTWVVNLGRLLRFFY
ncbi:hypothetical protein ACKGJO_00165 [Gracilimonas sp. Q87]|uniref:hypothetical protein n=1 Tax=Gracilimonas sp. Q87 TaxID=3384766 RepID=UPI0039844F93